MSAAVARIVAERLALQVASEYDVAHVIAAARRFCRDHGWAELPTAYVATAASELANNLWMHSRAGGVLWIWLLRKAGATGVTLVAEDDGPGIADLDLALAEGYSTAGGLGCGLPGVRRLMDEFRIDTAPGRGTRVEATKWLSR